MNNNNNRIHILNTQIDNLTMEETLAEVSKAIQENRLIHHTVVNAGKIVALQKNEELKQGVNNADIINADGQAVVWASKMLNKPLKERVAGIDLFTNLLELAYRQQKKVYLLGAKENIVKQRLKEIGYGKNLDIKIVNSTDKKMRDKYVKFLFQKMHRKQGLLERDCDRMIRNDRVIWSSCMVECGDADAMVTGNTRRYSQSLEKIKKVIPPREGEIMFGLNMVVSKGKTVFIGDTSVNEYPSSEELADIAVSAARVVRLFGFNPKVAFLSHSTFGQPITSRTKHIRDAVEILKKRKVDFKFDGDMQPDVALDEEYSDLYPFSEIVGNANILIMPGQHSAAISYKIMKTLGGAKVIGPLLIGLAQPIEIAPLRSSTSEILNLASVAAYSAGVIDYKKK